MKTQRIKPKISKKEKEAGIRRMNLFKLKKLLPNNVTPWLDGLLCTASGSIHIDVFRLEKQIPNYNGNACTYKGKPNYSMRKAIEEEWGKEAAILIESLL